MADEYIRKADVVKALDGKIIVTGHKNADAVLQYMKDISNKIKTMPSADVVQVVRCKDCEWAMKSTELPGWYMCKCEEAFDYYAKPDDFCSYGKRREEE